MYKRILVPIDGSRASTAGLNEAIRLAKSEGARLRLVHVVDQLVTMPSLQAGLYVGHFLEAMRKGGKKLLRNAEALARGHGLNADSVLQEAVGGLTAMLVVRQAKKWRADLIVIGTHGRRGMKRLVMGSDAEEIVRIAPVPVLLVRPTRAK